MGSQCSSSLARRLPSRFTGSIDRAVFGRTTARLGDLAKSLFKSLGITEERYKAVKERLHLDPKCNCSGRKQWLHEVGAELGVNGVATKFMQWLKELKCMIASG
jgi:hypothetical protein